MCTRRVVVLPGLLLDGCYFLHAKVQGCRHGLVHVLGIIALDEVRFPAVSAEQVCEFLVGYARQQCRVIDLVTVEMKDRQYRAVAHRVEELR